MSKILKITILLLSVIFCSFGIYLYIKRPPTHLVEIELGGCRIYSTDYFQRERCYENALSIYLNNPEFRDTALVAFQDVCNQGESNACFAMDELQKESSLNYSPFQEHIDNGNLDALRCINKKQSPQDPYIKDYYCNKAYVYGQLVKDTYLISEIEQNWRPFEGKFFLSQIEHNFVFDDAYNEGLFKKNCSSIQSDNQKQYCAKFSEVNNLRKKLFTAVYNAKKPDLDLIKSTMQEVCTKFPMGCWILSEEADFNIEIYKRHNSNEKSDYLKNFGSGLSLLQRMLVWAWIKEDGLLNSTKPFTQQDTILKLYLEGKHSEILGLCSNEKNNKDGCFLGFKDFGEAKINSELLEGFCEGKDKFSCKLKDLIKNNHILNIPDARSIKNLYHNYRSSILVTYLDYPLRKFSLFLDSHRTTIIALTIGFILIVQFFIIMLFKRSEDVFRFIRQQTIEKIQSKLNKRDD